jgi:WhiB family transcriptional regulator, redox-sensing transcriptional regulator
MSIRLLTAAVSHPALALAKQITKDMSDHLADKALCGPDPELHAGPDTSESAEERAARVQVAREVCTECPVLALCLARTLRLRPTAGVWAGLDAEAADWPALGVPKLERLADLIDDLGTTVAKQVA